MTKFTKDTILQCVPGLTVRVDENNLIAIKVGDETMSSSLHALTVLGMFAHPRTLAEAMNRLKPLVEGTQDWMDLTSVIHQLWTAGILTTELSTKKAFQSEKYSGAHVHTVMLNDRERTARYLEAIAAVVKQDDVVVDIGTGTGVLALAAARAGARHVYAIEATGIGQVARELFEANGFEDRISLVEGWSTRVSLPERADVLVSEMIGHNPLGEGLIEITCDARKRLLKPDARLIPSHVNLYGQALTVPPEKMKRYTFSTDAVRDWNQWYGLNFDPLVSLAQARNQRIMVKPQRSRDWAHLAPPVLLAEIDLSVADAPGLETTEGITVSQPGLLNGFMVYFELILSENVQLSVSPTEADEDNHWKNMTWVWPHGFPVSMGTNVEVEFYEYRHGKPNGLSLRVLDPATA